jgi:branched-subunit amino acid aminotransferase/4-amino-4-deoxychorismate lyase
MIGPWCSYNGSLIPIDKAVIPVDDINFSYGFGVYETLKVRNRVLFFPFLHEERLFHSAAVIGLEHHFQKGEIVRWILELAQANRTEQANIKVLLIGGDSVEHTRLYIMTLNPLFPDRKDYKQGATALIYPGERVFPEAKTLNMLVSTLALRAARREGAYDAVLQDREGRLTEGTRTNLFFTDGERVYTPPRGQVLEGVTKITLTEALRLEGIPVEEKELRATEVPSQQGIFLTSTSTKVMPLRKLGLYNLTISPLIRRIMKVYDGYLEEYESQQGRLF